ncbi:MAG: UvrD-helicase domain-containing protein [Trueperaceae bacterium]|nr:UvrD-helicase domain-containing protein [Trueperaceae bacterium]
MSEPLIDAAARARATTDAETTLVVTAGAGTGKTTLLVDRVLDQVVGRGLPLAEVVALTFTQKAANEMRVRLLAMLDRLARVLADEPDPQAASLLARVEHWMSAGHQKRDAVEARVRRAIAELDRAQIATIHGFAAHLLRLHPVEARVDPAFEVDAGDGFERLFERAWTAWLERELAADAPQGELWLEVLARLELPAIEQAARKLSGFAVPLEPLTGSGDGPEVRTLVRGRAELLAAAIETAAGACAKPSLQLCRQMTELAGTLRAWLAEGEDWRTAGAAVLEKPLGKAGQGWSGEAAIQAESLARQARELVRALLAADPAFIERTLGLLLPFARDFRRRYLESGRVSFDGLLVLARDLVRDHPEVRESLKATWRAFLVDEFQDTDPVQYEVVFFLCERPGECARDLRDVRLEPGKLFIVGDPKQSIYAFRRADIEAFEHVRRQVVQDGGAVLDLQANFRSHEGITRAVNEICGRLLVQGPFQPEYRPIHARRLAGRPEQEVELVRVVGGEGPKTGAAEARSGQADWLAGWIVGAVGKQRVLDDAGRVRPLAFRDIAVLFRSLSSVHVTLEALRQAQVPYVVEGEKYFYSNQEILDFVNLLRAIENPHDRIAMAGVLRAPLGGLTDGELLALSDADGMDYRRRPPPGAPHRSRLARLYAHLAALHDALGRQSLDCLLADLFDRTHLLELTAGAYQGEQKVANLIKLRRLAESMGREGETTLRRFTAWLAERVAEGSEEGESPLADETLDAVKVLSVHKAKGLEFPVVALANLHAGEPQGKPVACRIAWDWSDRVLGVEIGGVSNLGRVWLARKEEERQREEEKRVLYVAMTRARERLMLLGSARPGGGSMQEMVEHALQQGAAMTAGVRVTEAQAGAPRRAARRARLSRGERLPDWDVFHNTWAARRAAVAAPASEAAVPGSHREPSAAERLGSICHRVCETTDWHDPAAGLKERVAEAVAYVAAEVEPATERERLGEEAERMLRGFAHSAAARELRDATCLGRELPVLTATGRALSLDLLLRRDGRLVIGDFKTDEHPDASRHVAQGRRYVAAVAEALGEVPEFRIYWLRSGTASTVTLE